MTPARGSTTATKLCTTFFNLATVDRVALRVMGLRMIARGCRVSDRAPPATDVQFRRSRHPGSGCCGIEPDECYVFGTVASPERPDLAIEVVWTSGGVNKLEIYRRLGVREVWFWRRGKLTAHHLRGDSYAESGESQVMPGLNLAELVGFVDRPTASQAIREYRDFLVRRSNG